MVSCEASAANLPLSDLLATAGHVQIIGALERVLADPVSYICIPEIDCQTGRSAALNTLDRRKCFSCLGYIYFACTGCRVGSKQQI